MGNREPIQIDEWYHCYNRGVDKRKVFLDERDYERMLLHMFLGKKPSAVQLFNESDPRLQSVLNKTDDGNEQDIVEIGAYALMPTHFHFVLKEIRVGGIALFMQKVFTGYTMYFNLKNDRTGSLFAGTYKSKHVADDAYLRHLVSYVHLNPAELSVRKWKENKGNVARIEKALLNYPYSSLPEFIGHDRPHKLLLGQSIFQLFDKAPSILQMIREAKMHDPLNASVTD